MFEEEKRELPVFSQRIAGALMYNGYRLHGTARNYKHPEKNVFYFKDCQEVRNIIDRVKKELAKSNQE